MKLSEDAQEALEKLWIELVEKKKKRMAPDKFSKKILKELKDKHLIDEDAKGLRLTFRGREEAKGVIRRHRLSERLFHDLIHMNKRSMESPACKFEHALISGEVEEGICTLLGHPKECPHGRRIPGGRCCRERRRMAGSVIHPLSDVKKGQKGKVVYIQTEDHDILKKLMAMGILPGKTINLIQRTPSFVFSVGKTQVVVDAELASCIFVRVES